MKRVAILKTLNSASIGRISILFSNNNNNKSLYQSLSSWLKIQLAQAKKVELEHC